MGTGIRIRAPKQNGDAEENMPIYEYQCSNCHKTLEIMHKMSEPKPEECPSCQAKASLTKILSPTAFVLKGGGWYSDAYSSKPKPASSGASSTSSAPAESKASSDTKAETPAPKAPAKGCGSCD